jgi:hypothetical protein
MDRTSRQRIKPRFLRNAALRAKKRGKGKKLEKGFDADPQAAAACAFARKVRA